MNSRLFAMVATALLISVGGAAAQDKANQKFITEAIEGNYAEVQMGQLAQKNGQSEAVKSFGQMLTQDHGSANDKAIKAAQDIGASPPTGPSAKQKSEYDKMAKMSGAAFDKAFAQHMVADHKKDIAEYQKAAKRTDAAGKYAADALPTLQKHLQTAQSLQSKSTTGSR